MVAAIADLIRVKIPSSYEVSSGPWPHAAVGAHKGLEQRLSASGLLQGHAAAGLVGPEQLSKSFGEQRPLKHRNQFTSVKSELQQLQHL